MQLSCQIRISNPSFWERIRLLSWICISALFAQILLMVTWTIMTIFDAPHRKNVSVHVITKTRLFKYKENFTSKNWKFWDKKNSDIFHISAQNLDCGYSLEPPWRGGSNEYPQSMFLSRNKKNNVYPCRPQFYYIKVGFKGVNII